MFIRKLKSTNGKPHVQVVDKSNGKYKVVKIFASYQNESEIGEIAIGLDRNKITEDSK